MSYGYQQQAPYGTSEGANEYELENQQAPNSMVAFFGEIEDIKRHLVQYDDNIERIEGLHRRSLAETNVENDEVIQRQLETLIEDTRALSQTLKTRIKSLESKSQNDSTKKTQSENLRRQFMSLIQKFQATEAAFRQRYHDAAERQYRIVQPDATDAEVQEAIDDASGQQVFSQALMQSNRRGEARAALTEVQVRHREIQKIEQTLQELAQLFNDMEVLVAEQEEQVQDVDQNVGNAQHDIEIGVGHQEKAIGLARAWRKKKWICFVIVVVIVLGVALGVGLGVGLNHGNSN